ncbi:MAG: MurR/RpiR family transcriptional regulator [Clostridia bacterium]
MSAFTILKESMFGMSPTETRIAQYMLTNSEQLPQTTISTIAQQCQTSKSMVVQVCKKASFKGYKDMCSQLCVEHALHEQQQSEPDYQDLHPGCTVAQLCQLTIREEIRSIEDTGAIFEPEAMEDAVKALTTADKIVLFGVGSSAVVALDANNKFWRIGLNVRFSQDTHCQMLEIATMDEHSVALIFSYSGCTKDMLDACRLSRECGAKVISMTRYGHNPLSDNADIRLFVASNESLQRTTAMSSRLTMLTMVDVLFACISGRMYDEIQTVLSRAATIAAERKKV